MDTYLAALPDLPVRDVVPDVLDALRDTGSAVLVAPPGTGKTTVVPIALAGDYDGRIVVAEPRRVAARAAARRMASLLGERVGQTVGYSVRGDRKVSDATRIEVVTSGLLVRRLQSDPDLPGVSAVVLDECHERHLDADLLLALLLDVRGGLRDDLRLLATSATVAADRLAALLGNALPAPIVTARTPLFDVESRHIAPERGERVTACAARAVRTALSEADGDVLIFLPGVGEIAAVSDMLGDLPGVDVQVLHGGLTASEQDTVLREGERRRVVLATAIAESSVTVPGVRAVVDSGLARIPVVDHARGLSGLTTVRVSAAVAEQRAGRAARQGPGVVFRCWPEHEHSTLPAYPEPEIAIADLTSLALELACWGTPDGDGLSWWDAPPRGPLDAGARVLGSLGAVDDGGNVTDRGRAMARVGLHPRLVRALLDGARHTGRRFAAEVVALLDTPGASGATDVDTALSALRRGNVPGARQWRDNVARLERTAPDDDAPHGCTPDPAYVIALAHPERLARRRAPGARVYLMANGTAAELRHDGALADAEWLAVAEATRGQGRKNALIRLAAPADVDLATEAAATLRRTEDEIVWADGDVRARRRDWLGAIELSQRPLTDPDQAAIRSALLDGLRTEGTGLLGWTRDATALRDRLAFLHRALGEPWPAMDDASLLARADEWLEPELSTCRSRADLAALAAVDLLRRLVPWQHATRLDDLAPERIEVPTGSRIRVDYSSGDPVLAVRLQETFGWLRTPVIADGEAPVVLHLLSPAGRPCAVTTDLASFWQTGYPQVRAELRGRYPKHAWPEDPLTAEPTTRTNRRR